MVCPKHRQLGSYIRSVNIKMFNFVLSGLSELLHMFDLYFWYASWTRFCILVDPSHGASRSDLTRQTMSLARSSRCHWGIRWCVKIQPLMESFVVSCDTSSPVAMAALSTLESCMDCDVSTCATSTWSWPNPAMLATACCHSRSSSWPSSVDTSCLRLHAATTCTGVRLFMSLSACKAVWLSKCNRFCRKSTRTFSFSFPSDLASAALDSLSKAIRCTFKHFEGTFATSMSSQRLALIKASVVFKCLFKVDKSLRYFALAAGSSGKSLSRTSL